MRLHSEAAVTVYDSVYGAPDYVKMASYTEADVAGLPSMSFADPKDRKLPIHTKAAVWLSALEHYYVDGAPKAKVDATLLKTAEFFGIKDDVLAVKAAGAVKRSTARPERTAADYAVSRLAEQVYRLPIDTPEAALKSAADLQTEASNYPYSWRKEAAERVLEACRKHTVTPPNLDYLEKAAGLGATTPDVLLSALRLRSKAAHLPKAKQALDNAATFVSRMRQDDAVPPHLLTQVAEVMDRCDRLCGLNTKYASGLTTPEEACFQNPISQLRGDRAKWVTLGDGYAAEREKVASANVSLMAPLGDRAMRYLDDGKGKINPDALEKLAALMSSRTLEVAVRRLPFA